MIRLPQLPRLFPQVNTLFNTQIRNKSTKSIKRDTVKKLDSRKTYLVDKYTNILRKSPIVLVCHNNTLQKTENSNTRAKIEKAGGKLIVTRSNLFSVALRGLNHKDPASKQAQVTHQKDNHPLSDLFYGPTAIVTFNELKPSAVEAVVKVLDKTNEKLILMGGMVDGDSLTRQSVDEFKTLPSIEQMRGQLVGVLSVLGGAGLVQTLEASSKMLYLTMDERRKQLDPNEEKKEEE